MNNLIGIQQIRVEMISTTGSKVSQTFICNDFSEVINAVLERNSRLEFDEISVSPVMNSTRKAAGFTVID